MRKPRFREAAETDLSLFTSPAEPQPVVPVHDTRPQVPPAEPGVELLPGIKHPGRENRPVITRDTSDASIAGAMKEALRSRTVAPFHLSSFSESVQHWIQDTAHGDPNVARILMNALQTRYDMDKPLPLDAHVTPTVRDGITFWPVGHNASHAFYLGERDGSYYRMDIDMTAEVVQRDWNDMVFQELTQDEQQQICTALQAHADALEASTTEALPEEPQPATWEDLRFFASYDTGRELFNQLVTERIVQRTDRSPAMEQWLAFTQAGGAQEVHITPITEDELYRVYVGHV